MRGISSVRPHPTPAGWRPVVWYLERRTIICLVLMIGLLGAIIPTTFLAPGASARAGAGASTWARIYHGGDVAFGEAILRMPDGDIVVTGTQVREGALDDLKVLVARLSPDGDVRWSKTYGTHPLNESSVVAGIPCSPSGMMMFHERTLIRLNDDGTVRWARNYSIYAPSSALRSTKFTDVVQVADGGFAACGVMGLDGVFLCRLDSDGTPIWTKSYALYPAFGRQRIFSLGSGGGFLLGGRVPPGEGFEGVKLMWLSADGKVQRALGYSDRLQDRAPWYIQGFALEDMAMTPGGPVILQPLWSGGCRGTTVIGLDSAGAVRWTTWLGGQRVGNADVHLGGIDAAADGSLLLVGRTTEFSEHDDWGYDGMAAKLSSDGTFSWVSLVDREVFETSSYPDSSYYGSVEAMDDGGLAWATMAIHEKTRSHLDLSVIRMGPDGTAGKLGSYLTQVDVGDASLVRIEHPEVTPQAASRDSQSVTSDFNDVDVTTTDAGLTGSDVEGEALATLTLKPLYPANPGIPSSIMQGGTMYRYYRVLDAEGKPVAGAQIRYHGPFSTTTMTATSDASGEIVFSFNVPRSAQPRVLDSTLSIERVRVNGRRAVLAAAPDFATEVLALSWSTNWMLGTGMAGKVGLGFIAGGFGAAEQMGGMVLTRTAADPAKDGRGSMTVADSMSSEAAVGVQGDAGSMRLGTVEVKSADASAKVSLGTFVDFATLFDQPSQCSITEKLTAALTLLFGVGQAVSGGQTTLLSVAESAIVSALSGDVEMEHLTGGVSVGISGDVSALALELSKEEEPASEGKEGKKTGLSGVSLGKLSAGERALLSITAYPGAGEVSGKAAAELEASFSILEALGYSLADLSMADAVSAELVVDPLRTSFERLVLTTSLPPDDRGESQEMRLTIDNAVVGAAASAVFAQVSALAPGVTSQTGQRVFFTEEFCGLVLRNVVAAVASVAVPYEHVVTKDKNPTSMEVGLGVNILGNQVDLTVKPTWGRYQSFPVERGLFVALDDQLHIGRMVKLESYPASLFSSQVDTLPDVVVELLKVVGDLLSEVWDLATDLLGSAADTLLDVGAGAGNAIVGGATVLFHKGTSIVLSLFSTAPDMGVALLASSTASDTDLASDTGLALAAASSAKRVTLVGAPSSASGFCVGGVYTLEPENGTLSKPATLTLRYSAEAAGARDPATFSIYHYDAADRVWTPVSSSHDRAARTLTATITELGGYCIGSDSGAPAFALLLPSGTPAVVTTPVPELTVGCTEDGSGLVPSTFKATLDGRPLQAAWSPEAQSAALTVVDPLAAGTHELAVEGSDGTGNHGSATFEVEVRLPPGQAVLRLKGMTSEQVDLQLEAGQSDSPPAAYDVWRTDPGPGVAYRRLGTVTPDSGAYTDTNVLPSETYRYVAVALSKEDVEGPASEPLTVTVAEGSTSGTTAVTGAGTTAVTGAGTGAGAGSTQNGLSGAAIVAIAVSAVVAVTLAVAGVFVARRRRRK